MDNLYGDDKFMSILNGLPSLGADYNKDFVKKPDDNEKMPAMANIAMALLMKDLEQTRTIADNPDKYYEVNPILGKHPSTSRVNGYFGLSTIGHILANKHLPDKYKDPYNAGLAILEALVTKRNQDLGLPAILP